MNRKPKYYLKNVNNTRGLRGGADDFIPVTDLIEKYTRAFDDDNKDALTVLFNRIKEELEQKNVGNQDCIKIIKGLLGIIQSYRERFAHPFEVSVDVGQEKYNKFIENLKIGPDNYNNLMQTHETEIPTIENL